MGTIEIDGRKEISFKPVLVLDTVVVHISIPSKRGMVKEVRSVLKVVKNFSLDVKSFGIILVF